MHNSPSNSRWTVSIRVAASASPKFHKPPSSSKLKTIIIMSALALALALSLFSFLMWQKYRLPPPVDTSVDSPDCFLRMFSYMELKIATRNFRSKLGSGGFGSVFKGSLPDGTLVAVKKLEGSRQLDKQVRAEIGSLGNIQHANLIRLRGFCAEGPKRLLVYDYMLNGSLNSLLFTSNSKRKRKVLDWKTRFQIALGTARGLVHLHEECRDRIIHGDLKPENILLDGNFSPKLADFGLAKLVGRDFSRVLTTMRGTRGYLAPEGISGLPISPKVDVYSFAEADIEEVRRAGTVGLLCIEREEEMRPSMEQVGKMLEGKMEPRTPQMPSSALVDRQADRSETDSYAGLNKERACRLSLNVIE
ncbi:G-type lectin S-receptor-like serine/threonine-protein kinase At2g19130 [Cryptomeria japonica]|uniref:G-type lectin S-receptor-like serine/threonine-protein kinase At2g19130 n=1 Tax=Cryptomeria japonica TaxID=3369 RepID=UPI0027DA90EF|nr:G-type lectin S-receptor-like serine/threonine-protein kinase At2g19130 [Cryptomeria japonica]